MTHPLSQRRKWRSSKLYYFEDLIVSEFQTGTSLNGIKKLLYSQGMIVHRATILRYIKSLPEARLRSIYEHTNNQSSIAA